MRWVSRSNYMKICKLMFVDIKDGVQSNKYYNMYEQADNTFNVEYGRVGASPQKESYPMSKWQQKHKEKTKKGYQDITELVTESVVLTVDIDNLIFVNWKETDYVQENKTEFQHITDYLYSHCVKDR